MFYDDMAKYYSLIFPVESKAQFIHQALQGKSPVLDVGCSDGAVAQALAKLQYEVTAIDLNETMIALAKQNNQFPERLRYDVMNMLDMPFKAGHFGGIYCIGNTLVHLKPDEVQTFLTQVKLFLATAGILILQILNYSYILEQKPSQLPVIENDHIFFERFYQYHLGHIDFTTRLKDKQSGSSFENTTPLYPLLTEDLILILKDFGFENIQQYGSFAKAPYKPDSFSSIVVCQKS